MTNQDLQNRLLVLLENGYTVLAETERFVHQIQRQFRLRRIEQGKPGWDTPENLHPEPLDGELLDGAVAGGAAGLIFFFKMAISERLPRMRRPRLNHPAPDIDLIHLLDESFEQCLRFAMDPAGGQDVGPLIGWRRQIWRSFDDRLARRGLFHPARLPEKIAHRFPGLERKANSGQNGLRWLRICGPLGKIPFGGAAKESRGDIFRPACG